MNKPILKNNSKIRLIERFFPEEFFATFLMLVLLVVSLIYKRLPDVGSFSFNHYLRFFVFVLALFLVTIGKPNGVLRVIRNFLPLLFIIIIFENITEVITLINPINLDPVIILIDKRIFGGDPSIWMQRFIKPWLSNMLIFSYYSYFIITPLIAIMLYITGKYSGFRDYILATLLASTIGYVIYIFVPVIGPRFTLENLYTIELVTGPILTKIGTFINNHEPFKANCFPSLHAAHALIAMFFSARYFRKWFSIPMCILGFLLIIATMYGRFHYGIDIIAGIALAVVVLFLAPRINKIWYERIFHENWIMYYPDKPLIRN
ncbi:inositol phosphorylceramide synthase [bacterium]|nr:inositol phosphorylceramide synthase [bacterium]